MTPDVQFGLSMTLTFGAPMLLLAWDARRSRRQGPRDAPPAPPPVNKPLPDCLRPTLTPPDAPPDAPRRRAAQKVLEPV